MVRRRVRREPVAYILGRKGFRRIELVRSNRRVLIPRPETELLVEVALETGASSVIDVGTGSGAIALAVADELPEARVFAIDISMDALRVAQVNTDRLGLGDHVDVVNRGGGDRSPQPVRATCSSRIFPMSPRAEWEGLAPEIREYEPREALVAGETGLEAIEGLLDSARGTRVAAGRGRSRDRRRAGRGGLGAGREARATRRWRPDRTWPGSTG